MEINNKALFEANQHLFVKEQNAKSTLYASLIALSGIIIIAATALTITDSTSSMYMSGICVGIALLLWGGIKAFRGEKTYAYSSTKSKIVAQSLFFRPEELNALQTAIEKANTAAIKALKRELNSGIRLDVLLSQDHQFVACQVSKYVPHNYEPASEVYVIPQEKRESFCQCFNELTTK